MHNLTCVVRLKRNVCLFVFCDVRIGLHAEKYADNDLKHLSVYRDTLHPSNPAIAASLLLLSSSSWLDGVFVCFFPPF